MNHFSFSICCFPSAAFLCLPEEEKSHQEHQGKHCHAISGISREHRGNSHHRRSDKRSAFSEDIIEPEVLAGLLLGNNLRKIGTGQRLDRSLEHCDADRQEPEFPGLVQLQGKHRDTEVGQNGYFDQSAVLKFLRDFAESNRAGESQQIWVMSSARTRSVSEIPTSLP